jgi:hypothetical protein
MLGMWQKNPPINLERLITNDSFPNIQLLTSKQFVHPTAKSKKFHIQDRPIEFEKLIMDRKFQLKEPI